MVEKRPVSQRYKLLEIIGKGKFGTVHKGVDNDTKQLIAIKVLNLDTDPEEVKDIQQEIQFLSNLKSVPNITHYYGSYLNGHKLWIIMDYCAGGSVRTLLKPGPLQEKYISIITRELMIALQYIHEHGVIHRDIKAANILIGKDGKVKLCDFGVAAQLTATALKRTTMAGTPYWMAPEVITEGANYNAKADIWSAGITIYEMATGNPPYSDKDALRAMQFITQHEPPRLEGRQYGPLLKEIIAMCLEEKQDLRPSAEDLLIKSKFIKNSKVLPTTLLKEVIGTYLLWRDSFNSRRNSLQGSDLVENAVAIKKSHNHTPSNISIAETTFSMESGENYDIKWDFDSLKSAEYIVENDIHLKTNDEDEKFDDSFFDTNNINDFTTSPYNRTFTIGNTMINDRINNANKSHLTATATQIDSIITSPVDTPIKKEAPISLLQLFSEVNADTSTSDILKDKNGKHELTINIPEPQISQEILPTPNQIRQQMTSPFVPIEIPNMDVIENEIQEREKQRSRAATLNVMNHNQKIDSLLNDQPLPSRKPTISVAHRTPSPAKVLDQINTNLQQQQQASPAKQSSPLHMKPLPVGASQPLLQPLNNIHKTKQSGQGQAPQSQPPHLANLSTSQPVLQNGPQTAPVTSVSNSEKLESSIRARTQMRIQMPQPFAPTHFNSKEGLLSPKTSIYENSEKNQFGFDVNAASSIPLAMTPVTETPHPISSSPDKESSNEHLEHNNVNNTSMNASNNNNNNNNNINLGPFGYPSGTNITPQGYNLQSNTKLYSSNITNNNERKISNASSTKFQTLSNGHLSDSSQQHPIPKSDSGASLSEDSEQADVTLTNGNIASSSSATNTTNTAGVSNINNNMVTGLGMVTMHDSGNESPLRLGNSSSHVDLPGNEKLHKVIENAQVGMNKMVTLSLGMGITKAEGNNETSVYLEEIDGMLGRMNDILQLIVGGLNS